MDFVVGCRVRLNTQVVGEPCHGTVRIVINVLRYFPLIPYIVSLTFPLLAVVSLYDGKGVHEEQTLRVLK